MKVLQSGDVDNVKAIFKQREQKLMDFCRSIFEISDDLLRTIGTNYQPYHMAKMVLIPIITIVESGQSISDKTLKEFKQDFQTFEEILYAGQKRNPKSSSSPHEQLPKAILNKAPKFKLEDFGDHEDESIHIKQLSVSEVNLRSRDFNLLDIDGIAKFFSHCARDACNVLMKMLNQSSKEYGASDMLGASSGLNKASILFRGLRWSLLGASDNAVDSTDSDDTSSSGRIRMNISTELFSMHLVRGDVLCLGISPSGLPSVDSADTGMGDIGGGALTQLIKCFAQYLRQKQRKGLDENASAAEVDVANAEAYQWSPMGAPSKQRVLPVLIDAFVNFITELSRFIWQFGLTHHPETYLATRSVGMAGALAEVIVAIDLDDQLQVYDEDSIFSMRPLYNSCTLCLLILGCQSKATPSLSIKTGIIDSLAFRLDGTLVDSLVAWTSLNLDEDEVMGNSFHGDALTGGVSSAFADLCFPLCLLRYLSKTADVQRLLAASTKMQQSIKNIFRSLFSILLKAASESDHSSSVNTFIACEVAEIVCSLCQEEGIAHVLRSEGDYSSFTRAALTQH